MTRLWTLWAVALALANLVLLGLVVRLGATKAYAIDEFYFVHMTWQAVQGSGTFFDLPHSTWGQFAGPLYWSPAVLLGGDDPAAMHLVRLAMLPVLCVTLAAVAWLGASLERPLGAQARPLLAALLSAFLLLTGQRFVWHAIEIRPDCIALAAFLVCLALLFSERGPPRLRAALAGACLFVACVASVKAVIYGALFAPALLVDLRARAHEREPLLVHPAAFVGGFALGLLLVVADLALLGRLGTFWERWFASRVEHQATYPGFPFTEYLVPFLQGAWPFCLFALGGLALTLRDAVARTSRGSIPREWLLLAALPTTFASFALQRAPYAYSLLPLIAVLTLLAARAVMPLTRAEDWPRAKTLLLGAVLLAIPAGAVVQSARRLDPPHTNARQREVQRQIGRLVGPADTVYDMAATYVYRRGAHRFAFVDEARRARSRDALAAEVPAAIRREGTTLFVYDIRFDTHWRDTPLGEFLTTHFQPYNDDLRVWGRRWTPASEPTYEVFEAVRAGRYFVHPPGAAARLRIAGELPAEPIVTLEQGEHPIELAPGSQDDAVYLIWLPRDGRPFDPTRPSPPFELGRHILP